MYSKKGFFLDKPAPLTIRFLLLPVSNHQVPSSYLSQRLKWKKKFMSIFFVQNVFFQAMPQLMLVGSMATAWTGGSASSASATENSAKLSPIKSGTGIAQMIRLPKTVSVFFV